MKTHSITLCQTHKRSEDKKRKIDYIMRKYHERSIINRLFKKS